MFVLDSLNVSRRAKGVTKCKLSLIEDNYFRRTHVKIEDPFFRKWVEERVYSILRIGLLSVDNLTCFLIGILLDEVLVVLCHTTQGHTHVGEAAIVEESLHGHLLGEI